MAVQYRAGSPSFTNKQQVLNEMWSADSKPSSGFFMPVECSPVECPMDIQYVRTGAVPAGEDIRFYDLGKLSLATVGSQAVANVGELWATYEVVLRKPVLSGAIGASLNSAAMVKSFCSNAFPLGTVVVSSVNNSLGVINGPNSIIFPFNVSGKYFVSFFWYSSTSGAWTLPTVTLTNCSFINYNGFPTQFLAASAGNAMTYQALILIPDSNLPASIVMSGGTFLGASPNVDITVAPVDFDTVAT